MKTYPKYIQRIDDGEILVRMKDGKYYIKLLVEKFPNNLHFGWSYKHLMIDHKGQFKHYNQ